MIVHCAQCGTKNRVPAARLGDSARCGSCKSSLAPISKPHAVSSSDEFDEITGQTAVPVLVDFWAEWCGPCRAVAPELEKLAKRHEGELIVLKVDTEALPSLAARFNVRSIPTLQLYRGGKLAKQTAGAMSATQLEQTFGL